MCLLETRPCLKGATFVSQTSMSSPPPSHLVPPVCNLNILIACSGAPNIQHKACCKQHAEWKQRTPTPLVSQHHNICRFMRESIANEVRSPYKRFMERVRFINYNRNYFYEPMTLKELDNIDPGLACQYFNDCFRNPAQFTLCVVGSIEVLPPPPPPTTTRPATSTSVIPFATLPSSCCVLWAVEVPPPPISAIPPFPLLWPLPCDHGVLYVCAERIGDCDGGRVVEAHPTLPTPPT